jgi:hypothetical protein
MAKLLLVVKSGLFDQKVGQEVLADATGNGSVEACGLGSAAAEGGPPAGREGIDPEALKCSSVDLQVEMQVVDERDGATAIEERAEEGSAGGLRSVLSELGGEVRGLLIDPPAGRREDEADRIGERPRAGLEVEELRQVGDRDDASRDLLGRDPAMGAQRELQKVAAGAGPTAVA